MQLKVRTGWENIKTLNTLCVSLEESSLEESSLAESSLEESSLEESSFERSSFKESKISLIFLNNL